VILVSVGMPVYNGERFLCEAIESILAQTHTTLELIISDNGSTDSTQEICRTYAQRDERIRYVRQPKNIGPIPNFNFVMQARRGDYFMWAAHDDLRSPEYMKCVLDELRSDPAAVLAQSWSRMIETTNPDTPDDWTFWRGYGNLAQSARIDQRVQALLSNSNRAVGIYGLFRGSALNRLGVLYDGLSSDIEYLLRAFLLGRIRIVEKPLFEFRILNTSESYADWFASGGRDSILLEYRLLKRTIAKAALTGDERQAALRAFEGATRDRFMNRARYLTSEVVNSSLSRRRKLSALSSIARQYPPFARGRMLWGAIRRQVLSL
jgi:glycosyltransferase involved in cell wall biosynthesis